MMAPAPPARWRRPVLSWEPGRTPAGRIGPFLDGLPHPGVAGIQNRYLALDIVCWGVGGMDI